MKDKEILPFHDSARCLTRPKYIATERCNGVHGDATWAYDGKYSVCYDGIYERSFDAVLEGQELTSLLTERPYDQRNVLDLYGGAYIDIYDAARYVVGVRLKNIDDSIRHSPFAYDEHIEEIVARILQAPNRHVLEGNLLVRATWQHLRHVMDTLRIPAFDLVLCRPHAPFEAVNAHAPGDARQSDPAPYLLIYLSLLNRAYRLLSPDYGQLYTQIPEIPQIKRIIDIERKVSKNLFDTIPGIAVTLGYEHSNHSITYCMKLVRTPLAPPDLIPYFRTLSIGQYIDNHP